MCTNHVDSNWWCSDRSTDRTQNNEPQSHEELVHYESIGPKIWKVYTSRGNKVNSG
jgi:hypothetical protein